MRACRGKHHPSHPVQRKAFTLIELLVVIAIIALLISILLPSLGAARRTAWTVICQSNMKQISLATQLYLDDQKDPQMPNMRAGPNPNFLWYVGIVDAFNEYMGNAGNKPYDCPAAKGLSSVRNPENVQYLQEAQRVYTLPLFSDDEITTYTEYYFNDSEIRRETSSMFESGISSRKLRLIRRPDWVVWATDALDEFPRHQSLANTGEQRRGQNNVLFLDGRVKLMSYDEYYLSPDPYGAAPPFYNWGHAYPRNRG
ncbi:MAG: prepilin-type N-terminal cleavage/methylation domain-containing protein [Planctomycetota bacterium]|nr:prepilin-type N-terminal cleavage/methylation domain-containing protein [Planctomycetota bacterium]